MLSVYKSLVKWNGIQAVSWPLAMCIIVGAIASGAPFLVGLVLFLYFSSLLPFAYIYGSAEWKATELPSPQP